jgi:hypothetical protein
MTFKELILGELAKQNLSLRGVCALAEMDVGNTWRMLYDPKRKDCNLKTAIKMMKVMQIPFDRLSEVET